MDAEESRDVAVRTSIAIRQLRTRASRETVVQRRESLWVSSQGTLSDCPVTGES
jgi:hypothetical protein